MRIKSKIKLNDGYEIPRLGYGSGLLNGESIKIGIDSAIKFGYTHIDTAQITNNEYDIGKVIQKYNRKDLFITSKVWTSNFKYHMQKSIIQSLKRLNIEYLDLLLLHWPYIEDDSIIKIAYKELMIARKKGLVRSIGVSNFSIKYLKIIYKEFNEWPAVNQFMIGPKIQSNKLIQFCNKNNIIVEGYSLLRIFFSSENDPAYIKNFKRHAGHFTNNEEIYLNKLCDKYNKKKSQIIIRWALQRNIVIFPNSRIPSRIKENADVFDFKLLDCEMMKINNMDEGTNQKQVFEHINTFNPNFDKGLIYYDHF